MILYALRCRNGHAFEAWFQSAAAYEAQAGGEIHCPECGSASVKKAPMAPHVAKRGPTEKAAAEERESKELLALMRDVRAEVEANADYVGAAFPEEARKIHYEEAPARSIYGEASAQEARDLREEGIPVAPLPRLPEDRN